MLQQNSQNQTQKNKPKQIVVTTSTVGSLYTVPGGKLFKGHVYVPMGSSANLAINGQSTISFYIPNNVNNSFGDIQLELFEGDVIALTSASQISLMGVEYDA